MDRVEELEKALAVSEQRADALSATAIGILRELAGDRGAGPWFGGLLSRMQMERARGEWKWHAPDEVAAATGSAIYSVFSAVLKDITVPDFRHDAAISGDTANPLLYPAVIAAQAIAIRALRAGLVAAPDGQERLRLSRAEAVRQAEVQSVPSHAKGALKERWINASIAVIDAAFDADD